MTFAYGLPHNQLFQLPGTQRSVCVVSGGELSRPRNTLTAHLSCMVYEGVLNFCSNACRN